MTLPVPSPVGGPETLKFWEGTTRGELLLPTCNGCRKPFWYPRAMCPFCGAFDITWTKASGRGRIYSFTVHRQGQDVAEYRDAGAYVLAYVELEEGPRVLTNIVDCDPGNVRIDQPVEVVFHLAREGASLYRFRPSVAPPRTR